MVMSRAEARTYTRRAILNEGSELLSLMDLSLSYMVSQMLYETTLRDTALAGMTAGFLESIREGLYGERRSGAGDDALGRGGRGGPRPPFVGASRDDRTPPRAFRVGHYFRRKTGRGGAKVRKGRIPRKPAKPVDKGPPAGKGADPIKQPTAKPVDDLARADPVKQPMAKPVDDGAPDRKAAAPNRRRQQRRRNRPQRGGTRPEPNGNIIVMTVKSRHGETKSSSQHD